jgi:hypothetical protein
LEDIGIDGRILLKQILEKWNEALGWIQLVQNVVQLQNFVDTVLNLQFHKSMAFLDNMNNHQLFKKAMHYRIKELGQVSFT